MFQNVVPNLLIGLREGLEAALVVSILVAYLVKVGRRDRLPSVGAGVMVAVGVSLAFGAALSFTSASLAPAAQEAFGGVLSLVAVGFVTWMVFWMRRTARTLAGELRGRLDAALVAGAFAVAVTAFLAVAREGLETALFLWAAVQSTGGSSVGPLLGAAAGLAAAVALAWLLYRRAVRLNLSRFFTWTGAGLVLVAAGVCAYGVHDLQEAGWLPAGPVAFDLSRHVSADAWYAVLLRAIFNLHPTMTWLEVTAYLAYLVPVIWLFLHGRPRLQGALSRPAHLRCRARRRSARAGTVRSRGRDRAHRRRSVGCRRARPCGAGQGGPVRALRRNSPSGHRHAAGAQRGSASHRGVRLRRRPRARRGREHRAGDLAEPHGRSRARSLRDRLQASDDRNRDPDAARRHRGRRPGGPRPAARRRSRALPGLRPPAGSSAGAGRPRPRRRDRHRRR